MIRWTGVIVWICLYTFPAFTQDIDLTAARTAFYLSVEHKESIEEGLARFRQIHDQSELLRGRALTYMGALYSLKGKHAFWPHQKMKWVSRGLSVMDEGIALSPEDIEALFIFGSTCHYLPSFFKRGDHALRSFQKIIRLLPSQYQEYETDILKNMIDFLEKHVKLSDEERRTLTHVKAELK